MFTILLQCFFLKKLNRIKNINTFNVNILVKPKRNDKKIVLKYFLS